MREKIKQRLKQTGLVTLGLILGISWTISYYEFLPMYQERCETIRVYERVKKELNDMNKSIPASVEAGAEEKPVGEKESRGETPDSSADGIEAMIQDVFGENSKTALALAKSESQLNSKAHGDKNLTFTIDGVEYGASYGVFQIRYLPGRPSPDKLLNAEFNIRYAKALFDRYGFYPWTNYKNGRYKLFL